jgi:hypothetical protein
MEISEDKRLRELALNPDALAAHRSETVRHVARTSGSFTFARPMIEVPVVVRDRRASRDDRAAQFGSFVRVNSTPR